MKTNKTEFVNANVERWTANENYEKFMRQMAADMMVARKHGVSRQELRAALLQLQEMQCESLKIFIDP